MINVTKEWLHQKYVIELLSTSAIANILGCKRKTVLRKLHTFDIEIRLPVPKSKILNKCINCSKETSNPKFCSRSCNAKF